MRLHRKCLRFLAVVFLGVANFPALAGNGVIAMKKLLVAGIAAIAFFSGSALAADMAGQAPPLAHVVTPTYSWTGCYIGANGGGGWAKDGAWTDAAGNHGSPSSSGWLGGGQVGCDYQTDSWVIGIAGMFDWGSLNGSSVDFHSSTYTANTKVRQFDTATARLGYAFDRALFYVDGGAAWANTQRFWSPPGATWQSATTTNTGWTAGIGLEYMIAAKWSAKIEYNYSSFGSASVPLYTASNVNITQNINTLLVGINYRFGGIGTSP
jgi:outer membrane immunogenic protein